MQSSSTGDRPAVPPPLIVIGAGRSGSTLLHDVLAWHPNACWLSGLANRLPTRMPLHRGILQALALPGIDRLVHRHFAPSEAYDFWEHHCPGFRRPIRDLVAADLTPRSARRIGRALSRLSTGRRTHLSLKITGWPRVTFLRALFPDARFVHIVRDGRAVVNSLIATDWWRGWQGPQQWRWGELSAEHQETWLAHDRSFVALAAIQYNIILDSVLAAATDLPADCYLEMRYEDLCADPPATLQQVCNFAGWSWEREFERNIQRLSFTDTNDKYTRDLSPEQQSIATEIMGPYLRRYGYID
jgi:hypothetical protein